MKLTIVSSVLTLFLATSVVHAGSDDDRGKPGPQGPAGPQGEQGPAGPAGTNGTNGTNGTDGTNGADGAQGPAGTNGTNGTNGTDGTNGADGAQGPAGTNGKQGLAGTNGTNSVGTDTENLQNSDSALAALGGLELRQGGKGIISWSAGLGGIYGDSDAYGAIGVGIHYGIQDNLGVYGKVSKSFNGDNIAVFVGIEGQL